MTYQVVRIYVSLISTAVVFFGYCTYVWMNHSEQILQSTATPSFWGATILILIPVSIVAKIVVSILFIMIYRMVTKEEEPSFEDELDQFIALKASRISYYVFVGGFLLAMGSLVLEWPLSAVFAILIFSGFLAEIADGLTQIRLYRKGI